MAKQSDEVSNLRTKIGEFLGIDQGTLITRTQWGDLTFEDVKSDVDAIYGIVHLLNGLPLERLPKNAANDIFNVLTDSLSWIQRIDKFTIHEGSPAQNKNEIATHLSGVQENLYNRTHQWIPFLAYLKGDIPAQLDAITTSVGRAEKTNQDFDQYATDKKKSIDEAVAAAREASAKAGAAHFTKDFLDDAKERNDEADKWQIRALVSAAITVGTAIGFFFWRAPNEAYAVVQFTTSKLVILAMLIAITAWCAGNFRANKHQATVSRHKGHALQTFQAFVQASDNPEIKDAVLLETTRSIFSHVQSGYLKNDQSQDAAPRVMEVMRSSGLVRPTQE